MHTITFKGTARALAAIGVMMLGFSFGCSKPPGASEETEPEIENKPLEPRETRYDNGQIKERFSVAKNEAGSYLRHGKYEAFYVNGQKGDEGSYADDRKTGTWLAWHDNGKLQAKEKYQAGELEGEAEYYDKAGVLTVKKSAHAGKAHGPLTVYSEGKPWVSGQFVEGEADGTWALLDPAAGTKVAEAQLAKGSYLGKVKHLAGGPIAAEQPACDAVLGLRIGESRYADAKLGFLNHGTVPPDLLKPSSATGGPVIVVNAADLGLEHEKTIYLVFDKSDMFVAATVVMPKNRPTKYGAGFKGYFKLVKEELSDRFQLVDQRVPFVGNAFAKLEAPACGVTLDAPHMSFDMTVNYWLKGHENAVIELE